MVRKREVDFRRSWEGGGGGEEIVKGTGRLGGIRGGRGGEEEEEVRKRERERNQEDMRVG